MKYIFSHYSGNLYDIGIKEFFNSINILNSTINDKIKIKFFIDNESIIPEYISKFDFLELIIPNKLKFDLMPFNKRILYYNNEINKLIYKPDDEFIFCDCRDLVFYGDPFILNFNKIHIFYENQNMKIKDCECCSKWITDINTNEYDFIKDKLIVCSGFIKCDTLDLAKNFLNDFSYTILKYEDKNKWLVTDQGILTLLIYNNNYKNYTIENNYFFHKNEYPVICYHMGLCDENEYRIENNTIIVNNIIPKVIHQYDRRERAYSLIYDLYK